MLKFVLFVYDSIISISCWPYWETFSPSLELGHLFCWSQNSTVCFDQDILSNCIHLWPAYKKSKQKITYNIHVKNSFASVLVILFGCYLIEIKTDKILNGYCEIRSSKWIKNKQAFLEYCRNIYVPYQHPRFENVLCAY